MVRKTGAWGRTKRSRFPRTPSISFTPMRMCSRSSSLRPSPLNSFLSREAKSFITPRGFLISWATWAATSPMAESPSFRIACCCHFFSSVTSSSTRTHPRAASPFRGEGTTLIHFCPHRSSSTLPSLSHLSGKSRPKGFPSTSSLRKEVIRSAALLKATISPSLSTTTTPAEMLSSTLHRRSPSLLLSSRLSASWRVSSLTLSSRLR